MFQPGYLSLAVSKDTMPRRKWMILQMNRNALQNETHSWNVGSCVNRFGDRPPKTNVSVALPSLVLLFDRQFAPQPAPVTAHILATVAVGLIIALTAGNFASALLECGFKACADDPVVYELLKR